MLRERKREIFQRRLAGDGTVRRCLDVRRASRRRRSAAGTEEIGKPAGTRRRHAEGEIWNGGGSAWNVEGSSGNNKMAEKEGRGLAGETREEVDGEQ